MNKPVTVFFKAGLSSGQFDLRDPTDSLAGDLFIYNFRQQRAWAT